MSTKNGAPTTPLLLLLPPLLPTAKKPPKRRFRPIGIRAPNVTAPAPKKHRSLLEFSKSSDDTNCKSLNIEAANLNEEDAVEGAKNGVFEGVDNINVGSKCVNRDDPKQEQKVIPKLMNVDQNPIQQYPMVSEMTDNGLDMNTNNIKEAHGNETVSNSNASTPVKQVAASSDTICDNREERDSPLIYDIIVPTVMYTPKPIKQTTSKRPVDATPNDNRNAVSISVPNITAPPPKKDQLLLEFSTTSLAYTTCQSLNNETANLNEGNDIDKGKNVDEDEETNVGKDLDDVDRDVKKQEQKIIPKLIKHRPLHEFSTKPSNEIHKVDRNLTKLSRKIFDKNSNIREVMRELHVLLKDGKPENLHGAEIASNKSTPVIAVKLVAASSDAIHNNNDVRGEQLMPESPTNISLLTFSSSSSPLCNIMVPVTCTPKPSKQTTTSKRPVNAFPNDTRNAEVPVSIIAPYVAAHALKKHQSFEFLMNSSADTTCKSLNNEPEKLNEGDELDGAKNDVFEGEDNINVGSKCVNRDVDVHQQEQKIIPRLINLDQHPTQQYRKVSDVTAYVSGMKKAHGAEIVSNASSDNREKRDAPLMHGSCLWTLSSSYPFCWVPVTCIPQPSKHTICHMDADAKSNVPSNTSLSSSAIFANSFANCGAHHDGPTYRSEFESASLFSFDDTPLPCGLMDTSISTTIKSLSRDVPSEIGFRSQLTQEAITEDVDGSLTSSTSSFSTLNENASLLMFLRSQHLCIKGNIDEFYTWLVNEDIDCMSALKEAVSDDEYLNDSMKKGCGKSGIKGFKCKAFQRAVMEYKEVNKTQAAGPCVV